MNTITDLKIFHETNTHTHGIWRYINIDDLVFKMADNIYRDVETYTQLETLIRYINSSGKSVYVKDDIQKHTLKNLFPNINIVDDINADIFLTKQSIVSYSLSDFLKSEFNRKKKFCYNLKAKSLDLNREFTVQHSWSMSSNIQDTYTFLINKTIYLAVPESVVNSSNVPELKEVAVDFLDLYKSFGETFRCVYKTVNDNLVLGLIRLDSSPGSYYRMLTACKEGRDLIKLNKDVDYNDFNTIDMYLYSAAIFISKALGVDKKEIKVSRSYTKQIDNSVLEITLNKSLLYTEKAIELGLTDSNVFGKLLSSEKFAEELLNRKIKNYNMLNNDFYRVYCNDLKFIAITAFPFKIKEYHFEKSYIVVEVSETLPNINAELYALPQINNLSKYIEYKNKGIRNSSIPTLDEYMDLHVLYSTKKNLLSSYVERTNTWPFKLIEDLCDAVDQYGVSEVYKGIDEAIIERTGGELISFIKKISPISLRDRFYYNNKHLELEKYSGRWHGRHYFHNVDLEAVLSGIHYYRDILTSIYKCHLELTNKENV